MVNPMVMPMDCLMACPQMDFQMVSWMVNPMAYPLTGCLMVNPMVKQKYPQGHNKIRLSLSPIVARRMCPDRSDHNGKTRILLPGIEPC